MKKNVFLVLFGLLFVYGCSSEVDLNDIKPLDVEDGVMINSGDYADSKLSPSIKGPSTPPSVKGPTEPPN